MVSPGQIIVTTSWDDGHPADERLAALLAELELGATFYVPTRSAEHPTVAGRALLEIGRRFEIGAHTRHHARLPGLPAAELEGELVGGRRDLEDVLGRPIRMFCYPGGKFDRRVRGAVRRAGFAGARTTLEFRTDAGSDAWLMPTTLHAFPHASWVRLRHGLREGNWRGLGRMARLGAAGSWVDLGRRLFDRVAGRRQGVWHLWGHSWEIEEHGLWDDLRALLAHVARRPGVRYLTNGELLDAIAGPRPDAP